MYVCIMYVYCVYYVYVYEYVYVCVYVCVGLLEVHSPDVRRSGLPGDIEHNDDNDNNANDNANDNDNNIYEYMNMSYVCTHITAPGIS